MDADGERGEGRPHSDVRVEKLSASPLPIASE
jgi:hypothetical protein